MIGILVIGYVVLGALTAAIYMQQFRDGFGDLDPDEFAVSLLFGAIWPIMLPGCGMWVNRGNPHACVAHSCPHCGFWVNPHESHVCGPMPLGGPTSSFEAQRVATALESINILLAQVRDSLIKLATIAEQRLEFDMADYVDEPDPNQPVPGP